MPNLVVLGHTPDERIHPIVRQSCGQSHAGFDKLGMDLIVDVHRELRS
jgi:hypothetical protein